MALDVANVAGVLVPISKATFPAQLRAECDDLAYCIKQQLDVGGENKAVDRALDAIDHDPLLRQTLDTSSAGVHQLHVEEVEGFEVIVMEARALAQQAVRGLERLGRRRIQHHAVDALSQTVHQVVVTQLREILQFGLGRLAPELGRDNFDLRGRQGRIILGPAVVHEVTVLSNTGEQRLEVAAPLTLPARLRDVRMVGLCLALAAYAYRRRRALEDEQLLGVSGDRGHDLDSGRASADDGDALVNQARETATVIAAGVVIVPAAGVERVARELVDSRQARQLGQALSATAWSTRTSTATSGRSAT